MIVQYRGGSQDRQLQSIVRTPTALWEAYVAKAKSDRSPKSNESKAKTWAEAEENGLMLAKTWLDGLAELFELWVALRPTEAETAS